MAFGIREVLCLDHGVVDSFCALAKHLLLYMTSCLKKEGVSSPLNEYIELAHSHGITHPSLHDVFLSLKRCFQSRMVGDQTHLSGKAQLIARGDEGS